MLRIMKYEFVNTFIRTAVLGGTPTEQTGARARFEQNSLSLENFYHRPITDSVHMNSTNTRETPCLELEINILPHRTCQLI